jgi:hypothetical protein
VSVETVAEFGKGKTGAVLGGRDEYELERIEVEVIQ